MSIYKSGLDLMDQKVKKYKEDKGVEYKETSARTAVKPPVEQKLNSVGITPSAPTIKKSNPPKKTINTPIGNSTTAPGNTITISPPTPPKPKSPDNNLSPYDNVTKWTQPKDTQSSPPDWKELYKNINKWIIPDYKKSGSTSATSTKPKGSSAFEIFSKSFMKRYFEDKYYADVYKDMLGQANNKDYYKSLIEGGFYDFTADSLGKKIAAKTSEFLGDQYLHFTDPRSLSAATGAAGAAAIAGNASPLAVFPEELLTVPSAAMLGLKSGAAVSAYESETGYIFDELTKNGISRETAKKIALGAGGLNAGLEMIQVDDLLKSFNILKNSKKGGSAGKKIFDFLLKHVANASAEAGIDTLQEGVDITAKNTAAMLDDKDFTYEGARKRLTDTYKSSFPAYLLMGMAGDGINYAISNTLKNKSSANDVPDTTPEASARDINKLSDSEFEEYIRRIKDGDNVEDLFDKSYKKSSINSYNAPEDLPEDLFEKYLKRRTDGEEPEDMADLFEEARKRELTKRSGNDIINITGARITNPNSNDADNFAQMYYKEIRSFSTDCERISKNIDIPTETIRSIKNYLFINNSKYNIDSNTWEPFDPDCAIAQSWQRLMTGKDIKPHDLTLIKHELLEMEIKCSNKNISHDDAHNIASQKYNYPMEAKLYYDNLKKHKKNE